MKKSAAKKVVREQVVSSWPVLVAGVEGVATGDADAVTVVFPHPSRDEIVRLVNIAWNGERFWPFSAWRAIRTFSLVEFGSLTLHGEASK